ncbi:MAG TPA: FkbM family methyltransferase [Gallionella sp.]|nr:FkbM family methyltransferase [Gallionella sp.]
MKRPLEQGLFQLNNVNRTFFSREDSAGDRGVIQQIFVNRDYDLTGFPQHANLTAYYSSLINSGKKPLIIDAGANIGASVVYFSAVFPQCKILAIEPEKDNCRLLRMNSKGLDVSVLEGGISCKDGFLFLNDPGYSDWGFRLGKQGDYQVPVYSVKDLIEEQLGRNLSPFIFKMDIEGGESEVFKESTDWIRFIPVLIIELHDWLFPGTSNSNNFLRAISSHNFDFLYRGENVFCFNNDLLLPGNKTG